MEPPPTSSSGERSLDPLTSFASIPLTRHNLASLRSLVINPSTPISLITSIFEALSRHLENGCDSLLVLHALKLLSELASHRPGLSPLILDCVRSRLFSSESARVAAESFDVIALVAERDESLFSSLDGQFDSFFVSLCFNRSVSVRQWLLWNAQRFGIGPHVLVTVFLGFTKDPYPRVREAALDGLVNLSKSSVFEDRGLVEGCYCRAVELLGDVEACVRCAAVRTVCDWGRILVASMQGTEKREQSDAIFIQLCSMVRDMSMEVRVEAFVALGKTETVSLKNLLQSLSKKVLGSMKENRSVCQSTGPVELSASSVAGALVHGFEDEYYEVRRSVCHSMRRLCMISSEFAGEAINLLMDMLNDDSVIVRLKALEMMCHMATSDHLSLEVMHMHMFLGTLVDKNELVRGAARQVLKFVKLRNLELLKLSVNGLIENLETYPQDEVDIFAVLFHVGQRHGLSMMFFTRVCEEELETLETKCTGSPALAFTLQYIRALKLLASVWSYFHPTVGQCCREVSQLDILLVKLERTLRNMKCRFTGLSKEDELYLMELTSVSLTLNLSKLTTGCGYIVNLKRLAALLSWVECLQLEHGVERSSFLSELKKSMPDIHSAAGSMFSPPHFLRKMLDAFSLKQFELSRTLLSLSAEIAVPDNDSENPIHFIHGLPVGIRLEITLCNISRENRLWLEMTMGKDSKQFIFLDLKSFGGSNESSKVSYFATYYKTPKAVSFTLRVCIGVECFPEDIHAGKNNGGPKRELTYLSPEREVYFSAKSLKLT
ncbi:hypothetical protein BT93_K0375 [Corymbia citriodora subsp. variegata]|nr:hypothetical protein BT93_K0375 [Corymbia citriodora subsp. variegata]